MASALPNTIEELRKKALEYAQQAEALRGQEPDLAAFQDYARQRGESGQSSLLNALAAQYAGEGFQPLQAQFLKKSAAAYEPTKVGNVTMTPEGKVLRDPFASRDKQVESLLGLGEKYDKHVSVLEQAQLASQERAARNAENDAYKKERDAQSDEFRRLNLGLQKDNAAERERARKEREDSKRNELEFKFSNQFKTEIKSLDNIVRTADFVRANAANAKAKDPQAQMAMVYQFMKALDEGSVVRESEYAMAANARPLIEVFKRFHDQAMSGTRLSPSQIDNMVATVERISEVARTGRKEVEDSFERRAIGAGIRPEQIFGRPYGTSQSQSNLQPNAATPSRSKAPAPGTLQDGYRFKGGDPAQPSNWEKL